MIDPVNLAIDNDNPFCKDKKIVKLTTTEKYANAGGPTNPGQRKQTNARITC